jgi:hypothetical protein
MLVGIDDVLMTSPIQAAKKLRVSADRTGGTLKSKMPPELTGGIDHF